MKLWSLHLVLKLLSFLTSVITHGYFIAYGFILFGKSGKQRLLRIQGERYMSLLHIPSSGSNVVTLVSSYLRLSSVINSPTNFFFFLTKVKCIFVGDTNCFRVCPCSLLFWFKPLVALSTAWVVINGVESDMEMNSEVSLWHCWGPSVNVNV